MNRTAVFAAIIFAFVAPAARAQQSALPTPPKPVHPTPIPSTSCRGCSDGVTGNATSVKGYDDKAVDTSRSTAHRAAAPLHPKVKHAKRAAKHSRTKLKTASKAKAASSRTATAKTSAAAKSKPRVRDKPAVLDPMITPRGTLTIKAKPDTVRK